MMKKSAIEFEQKVKVGCGIDVHEKILSVSISSDGKTYKTYSYGTFTKDLYALLDLLVDSGVESVAIESTGVYWKPVYNILSAKIPIQLVNARSIKGVPGNKTDVKDSKWLCKLLLGGLLRGSFIPPEKIRDLRDLTRYQTKLDGQKSSQKNRIHKILEDCNIKLSSVVSKLSGSNATKMIASLLAGEESPQSIANKYHHPLMKVSKSDLAEALTGKIRPHHHFMLSQIQNSIYRLEEEIQEVQLQIDLLLSTEIDKTNIELLSSIPGVGKETAEKIIAEIGEDMSQFPTESHLCKWAGLSPGNNETGGKKKSSRITSGNKNLKAALCESSWAASRTKGTYLRAKYNSMIGRKGKKKAIIVLAHKILISAYHILSKKESYKELGERFLEERLKANRLKYLKKQLNELGYEGVVQALV